MTVIVADANNATYDGNLSTVNGFYRAEAYNLGAFHATAVALNVARYIPVTFANSGNCQGIVLCVQASSITTRSVTVTLQENVATVWTDRVSTTITASNIVAGSTVVNKAWIVPFLFATPYAVSAVTSTWRFKVERGAGTQEWNLTTSDGTNPFYVTWCDNQVSFNNDDCLICVDKTVIDRTSKLLGVLGTGDVTNGVCGVICRSADMTKANTALLEWQNPPAASYTLTVDGVILMSCGSGFRIGTETDPIHYDKQAIVVCAAPTVGTTRSGSGNPATTYSYSSASFLFYGEPPSVRKTTLASDANSGQPVIETTDATGWSIGDKIVIGKEDRVTTTPDYNWYTIQNIVGTTITLTTNLAYKRLAGGQVFTVSRYGVEFSGPATTGYGAFVSGGMANHLEAIGVSFDDVYVASSTVANSALGSYREIPAYTSDHRVEDCVLYGNSTTVLQISGSITTTNDTYVKRCYVQKHRIVSSSQCYGSTIGNYYIDDCVSLACSSAPFSMGSTYSNEKVTIRRLVSDNCVGGNVLKTLKLVIEDCVFYGSASTWALLFLENGAIKNAGTSYLARNSYQRCVSVWYLFGSSILPSITETDSHYGDEYANTRNFYVGADCLLDYTFKDCVFPTGTWVMSSSAVRQSKLRFVNANGIANNDYIMCTYGNIARTGSGLTDTTVHTAGTDKFAIRFEPLTSTDNIDWEFTVPTGDILGRTMTVAVWCKINSATYYAGTHQQPRLTLDYDDGTVLYTEATESTDWQLLVITFVPTTSYGQITVTISGRTDAVGTDAYFYLDDMAILYPSGYKLDMGGMDLWANALPITPPIATVMSAADVWTAATTGLTGAGTIGKLLTDNVDAAISTRLAAVGYTAPPSAATIAGAVMDESADGHTGWLTKLLSVAKFLGLK